MSSIRFFVVTDIDEVLDCPHGRGPSRMVLPRKSSRLGNYEGGEYKREPAVWPIWYVCFICGGCSRRDPEPRTEELERVLQETNGRCICEIEIKGSSYAAKPVTVFTAVYASISDEKLVDFIVQLRDASGITPEYGRPIRPEDVTIVSRIRYDF